MPTGDVLDSRDSVEDRPLSAAKLSAESERFPVTVRVHSPLSRPQREERHVLSEVRASVAWPS